jgi:hypothetical protein
LLLVSGVAGAVDARGHVRLWLGPGFDSNARRDFVSAGVPTDPDFFFFGLLSAEGSLDLPRARLLGTYEAAGRKFTLLPSEDTEVQNAQVEGMYALARVVSVGLAGRARDRRGADRDYTDLGADVVLDFLPDAAVDVRLRGGPHRFIYWTRFPYSYSAPEVGLTARYRFNRRHSVSLGAMGELRKHNADATALPGEVDPVVVTRRDTVLMASVSYSYRGPFQLMVGYSYLDQASNSFGESLRRHRFTATAGFRLPFSFLLMLSGALQFSEYPDGVYLSPDLQVAEDEENSSSITAKLVRPLGEHVDLDVRYALYANALPQNHFTYTRHLLSLGVTIAF